MTDEEVKRLSEQLDQEEARNLQDSVPGVVEASE